MFEVDDHAVEAVRKERAARASIRGVWAEHEVVDEQLRASAEEVEWARMDDAPIDRATGQVIYTVGGDLARTFPAMTVRVELLAPEREGDARLLGEYTFEHTPIGRG